MIELTMHSLTWTRIQTGQPQPQARDLCTLTAITDNQLVLHGGKDKIQQGLSDTWIMDLTSHSWRQYTSGNDHIWWGHTSSSGLNSNAIIFNGFNDLDDTFDVRDNSFHVMLEPMFLQQLAMQIMHRHQDELPWNCLPRRLISLLGISVQDLNL